MANETKNALVCSKALDDHSKERMKDECNQCLSSMELFVEQMKNFLDVHYSEKETREYKRNFYLYLSLIDVCDRLRDSIDFLNEQT